jgi:hypothetical protein
MTDPTIPPNIITALAELDMSCRRDGDTGEITVSELPKQQLASWSFPNTTALMEWLIEQQKLRRP